MSILISINLPTLIKPTVFRGFPFFVDFDNHIYIVLKMVRTPEIPLFGGMVEKSEFYTFRPIINTSSVCSVFPFHCAKRCNKSSFCA